jgi:hypothetical protein
MIFVTGGAGYIGSHTCVELLDAGCDVTVFPIICCHLLLRWPWGDVPVSTCGATITPLRMGLGCGITSMWWTWPWVTSRH